MLIYFESLGLPLSIGISVVFLVATGLFGLFIFKALERRVIVFVKYLHRLMVKNQPGDKSKHSNKKMAKNTESHKHGMGDHGEKEPSRK